MLILYKLTARERGCLSAVEYHNRINHIPLEISKVHYESSIEYSALLGAGLIKDEAWATQKNPQFTITDTGLNALKQNPF